LPYLSLLNNKRQEDTIITTGLIQSENIFIVSKIVIPSDI
jgi:hypothetical protein